MPFKSSEDVLNSCVWIGKGGEEYVIENMSENHLRNVLSFIYKNRDSYWLRSNNPDNYLDGEDYFQKEVRKSDVWIRAIKTAESIKKSKKTGLPRSKVIDSSHKNAKVRDGLVRDFIGNYFNNEMQDEDGFKYIEGVLDFALSIDLISLEEFWEYVREIEMLSEDTYNYNSIDKCNAPRELANAERKKVFFNE